jgi:PAS domain S-box-containing protein
VFGTVQDITERRRAEALLHAQAQEIRAIVENSPDIIVRYDLDLHRTYVNPAFVKATGLPREALLGREIASPANQGISNATPEEIALLRESLKRVRDTGQPLDVETSWLMPIGRRSFASHFEPEFDTQGKLRSVLGISRDITELKAGEEKLRQMEAELARMSQLTIMGELAASIAHEINQPLAAVVTNANASLRWLAAAPPNLDEAREAVLRIIRDGNRAGNVIARIRTLLKKGEPVRAPLNINEVVQETIALTQPELARRKVLLQLALASELPRLQADRIQLQQVLLNLMVNALDSLSGVADRVLHIRTEYQAPDAVRVAVKDTGIGVDREQSERLFQAFFTTKPQGLGMGLAISRSIIEAHGGRLWMTPNEGPGVTFQFTLPIQNGDAT